MKFRVTITESFCNDIVEAIKLGTTFIACVIPRLNQNIWDMLLCAFNEHGILVDIFDEHGILIYESNYDQGFMFASYPYLDKFGRQEETRTIVRFYSGSLPDANVKKEESHPGKAWIDGVRHLIIDYADDNKEESSI